MSYVVRFEKYAKEIQEKPTDWREKSDERTWKRTYAQKHDIRKASRMVVRTI